MKGPFFPSSDINKIQTVLKKETEFLQEVFMFVLLIGFGATKKIDDFRKKG